MAFPVNTNPENNVVLQLGSLTWFDLNSTRFSSNWRASLCYSGGTPSKYNYWLYNVDFLLILSFLFKKKINYFMLFKIVFITTIVLIQKLDQLPLKRGSQPSNIILYLSSHPVQ